jgi:deoxyribodipyrimidine photo-lyase
MAAAINIFWFRRDLRFEDNTGLFHALNSHLPVLPVFIFDKNIIEKLSDSSDRRVEFIHNTLSDLNKVLAPLGSCMKIFFDTPENAFDQLIEGYNINAVFTNHDYEQYAINRDNSIKEKLANKNIQFFTFKDHVIFEKDEVIKDDGKPYTIFTPYSRKWKNKLISTDIELLQSEKLLHNFLQSKNEHFPSLNEIGFKHSQLLFPEKKLNNNIVKSYAQQRDIPGISGTSKIGIHLRFGTISIRSVFHETKNLSDVFINELIWRDFYQMILWHFPYINHYKSFKPAYDNIEWRNNEIEFEKWCIGQTGYPIVDAGMRELNETGFMHNRVRMITASFLCKHLLIDWRWGEAYFANKLLDFDFASNNGGWQWAAGSGCDAAPYFRVFNPYLQTKKFDPDFNYIKKWVPEFQELTYPKPIVDHEFARKRCLEVYGKSLKKDNI